jgi:hypothetical protein
MTAMLSGAVAMGSAVIALFFLRFWRSSGDRFFLYFSLSFAVQAIDRVHFAVMPVLGSEADSPFHYLIRLMAYALILWAILDKNWPRRKKQG